MTATTHVAAVPVERGLDHRTAVAIHARQHHEFWHAPERGRAVQDPLRHPVVT